MANDTRELKLKLSILADATGANRVVASLGEQAAKAAEAAGGKAAKALADSMARGLGHGGGGGAAGGPAGGGMSASLFAAGSTSRVSAFDRPIPVVVVGPKSLLEGGMGGKGGGAGGGSKNPDPTPRADNTLAILRNLGLGGIAGRMGAIQGHGEALQEIGAGKLGRGLANPRTAGALAALGASVDVARESARLVNDPYITQAQRMRVAFRRLAPFGETIQGAYDDFTGRDAEFQKAAVAAGQEAERVQSRLGLSGFHMGFNPQRAAVEERARLLGRAGAILEPGVNRSTATGQRAFEDMQRLLPLERESAKLARERDTATAHRAKAEAEDVRLKERSHELEVKAKSLADQLNDKERRPDLQSGTGRFKAMAELENVRKELFGINDQRHRSLFAVQEARVNEARAKQAFGMAGVMTAREKAALLEERADRSAGAATRIGGMGLLDRRTGIEALKLAQANPENLSSLPPELLAAANAIAPRTFQKLAEQHGAGSAEFAELRRIAPGDYEGDPNDLREKARQGRNEAARDEMKEEAVMAAAAAEAGKNIGARFADIAKLIEANAVAEVERRMQQGKTQGH